MSRHISTNGAAAVGIGSGDEVRGSMPRGSGPTRILTRILPAGGRLASRCFSPAGLVLAGGFFGGCVCLPQAAKGFRS